MGRVNVIDHQAMQLNGASILDLVPIFFESKLSLEVSTMCSSEFYWAIERALVRS